jgi:hypothetical protein
LALVNNVVQPGLGEMAMAANLNGVDLLPWHTLVLGRIAQHRINGLDELLSPRCKAHR